MDISPSTYQLGPDESEHTILATSLILSSYPSICFCKRSLASLRYIPSHSLIFSTQCVSDPSLRHYRQIRPSRRRMDLQSSMELGYSWNRALQSLLPDCTDLLLVYQRTLLLALPFPNLRKDLPAAKFWADLSILSCVSVRKTGNSPSNLSSRKPYFTLAATPKLTWNQRTSPTRRKGWNIHSWLLPKGVSNSDPSLYLQSFKNSNPSLLVHPAVSLNLAAKAAGPSG